MKNEIIEAIPGEMLHLYIMRVISLVQSRNVSGKAIHNGTCITIYPESYLGDIVDKFILQRQIDDLQNSHYSNG